jgi:cytidylate kinase
METIIISGMSAAGKTTVSQIIAKRLHIKALGGGDILRELALERGYKPTGIEWWDTPDGIKFLRERKGNTDFDKEADRILLKKIKAGNIVVTSYTAAWISRDGFKVWLDGSKAVRAARMGRRDKTGRAESLKVVKIRDKDNFSVYKKLYNIDFGRDKTPFDLVIDTNSKTPKQISDMILKKFRERNKM